MTDTALLALEDGALFYGDSIGAPVERAGELVFNTAISGYQEILTDPSYYKQIVTLTHPHIGNTGVNPEDEQSDRVFVSGLVIRDLPLTESNWRAKEPLADYLKRHDIPAIAGVDTRRLTRHLREHGAMRACLSAGRPEAEQVLADARAFTGLVGQDLAAEVSTTSAYPWREGSRDLAGEAGPAGAEDYRVIAVDYGVKHNILRILADLGCAVTVMPARTTAEAILSERPDGVFLSNGPGDPDACDYAITAIAEIVSQGLPVFGICLGHQLLALALGAKTIKMKFGHHGANHPVQSLADGGVLISSQNHGFAVAEESLPEALLATHRSLFDGTLQGVRHKTLPAFGFQGHPEASPGPHDLKPLFQHFIALMREYKAKRHAQTR